MAFTVGLVAEGVTDLVVIERIVRESLEGAGLAAGELRFEMLQPERDATSGQWSDGGHGHVKAWCLRYPPGLRLGSFLQPLFAGVPARCDLIVVHLDADVIVPIAHAEGLGVPDPLTAFAQGVLTRAVLERWLWPDPTRPGEGRHTLLPAVQATETWIVAGADPALADPESADPVPLLIALNPGLSDGGASPKLKKSRRKWGQLFRRHLAGQVADVAARCPHLQHALSEIHSSAPLP
ncbi:MAG: hypothetical protein H6739_11775 [Alphaproteobacteria bacterium]|nr:hypothetical protein [Alphaproteobacteria bacterium]